jgi:Tfp pilus assembly protein PilV
MYGHSYNKHHVCRQAGITLIEVLVVLALVVGISGMTFVLSLDTYRDSSLHADRMTLVSLLMHARAQSLHDVCGASSCTHGASHGVYIQPDHFVLFEGDSYALRDTDQDVTFDANPHIIHTGISEMVFASSSALVSTPGAIVLVDTGRRSATTTIGGEGQISWDD